jgi:steroid 5-alpha reductase family enzyme
MVLFRHDCWSWRACKFFGDRGLVGITGARADIRSKPPLVSLWLKRVCWRIYRGSEDYRWIYVRKLIHKYVPSSMQGTAMVLFNFIFISFIQNILLFLLTAPYPLSLSPTEYGIWRVRVCRNYLVLLIGDGTPVNYKDVVCITALVASISLETLADEQQWIYQNTKHAKPSSSDTNNPSSVSYCKPEDLKRGFLTGGLFRYSRHPNFACEQANWYFFYAFGCIATVSPRYPWCFFVLIGSGHCGIGLLLDLWRLL